MDISLRHGFRRATSLITSARRRCASEQPPKAALRESQREARHHGEFFGISDNNRTPDVLGTSGDFCYSCGMETMTLPRRLRARVFISSGSASMVRS